MRTKPDSNSVTKRDTYAYASTYTYTYTVANRDT